MKTKHIIFYICAFLFILYPVSAIYNVSFNEIIEILKGLLTPIIGVSMVYIAYQQHKTNQQREQRESRKAKLDVYKKVKRFLHDVAVNNEINPSSFEDFTEALTEADFLFPKDIIDWLTIQYAIALEWKTLKEHILNHASNSSLPLNEFIDVNGDARQEMIRWNSLRDELSTAYDNIKEKFSKHLKLK